MPNKETKSIKIDQITQTVVKGTAKVKKFGSSGWIVEYKVILGTREMIMEYPFVFSSKKSTKVIVDKVNK